MMKNSNRCKNTKTERIASSILYAGETYNILVPFLRLPRYV